MALASALSISIGPALAQRTPGLRPAADSDEGQLWSVSDKAELSAKNSGELNTDPELHAYVKDVACRVAPDYCADIRIYIMERPFMNASAAPNGYVEIWTGAMLRSTSEAEMAFIIGHEISHYTQQHSLKAYNNMRARANVALGLSLVVAVAGVAAAGNTSSITSASDIADAASLLTDIVYLGAMAGYFGFNREQELEADRLGLQRVMAARYDGQAAIRSWGSLLAETKASDFEKVRRSDSRTTIFSTHPLTTERVQALDALAASGQGGDLGQDRHRAAVRSSLGRWLRDDLRRRDYGQTLHLIDRLMAGGEDLGVLNYYKGEAYRLRRQDGDLVRAREAYASAVTSDDAPAPAWRELGDMRRREGDRAGAREAFEAYLTKTPDAEDAWIVRDSLKSLN